MYSTSFSEILRMTLLKQGEFLVNTTHKAILTHRSPLHKMLVNRENEHEDSIQVLHLQLMSSNLSF